MPIADDSTGKLRPAHRSANAEDRSATDANIETYLDNHIREGAQACQQNMVARPDTWHPLETGPQAPNRSSRTDRFPSERARPDHDVT